jgi:hypothetical protein
LVASDVTTDNDGDSVTVRLQEKSTSMDMTDVATADASATVVWSDNAEDNVLVDTVNWFTDAKSSTLPLDGQTLSN